MKLEWWSVAVLALSLVIGVSGAEAQAIAAAEQFAVQGGISGSRLGQASKEGVSSEYWFEMTPSRRQDFVYRVKSLALGVPRAEVVKLLGPPDSTFMTAPKSDPRESAITGRALTYYVRKWRRNESNTGRDEEILLWFDRETDRLRKLFSSTPEIANLGVPLTPR